MNIKALSGLLSKNGAGLMEDEDISELLKFLTESADQSQKIIL